MFNSKDIPPALVLGCNTPHGIGVLSDYIEEQIGHPPDFNLTSLSNSLIFNCNYDYNKINGEGYGEGYAYNNGNGRGNGFIYGYGDFDDTGNGNGNGNGCGYNIHTTNGAYYGYGDSLGNGTGDAYQEEISEEHIAIYEDAICEYYVDDVEYDFES